MIKTLQITSILAVIMAAVLLVSSVVFGVARDEQAEAFLKSPTLKEQFSKISARLSKRGDASQTSPLVSRAQQFAEIINPPKPKVPVPKTQRVVVDRVKPPEPTALFKVIGTSYCQADPAMSLVFIDEPGKGLRWVRQGSEIMHVVIEEVKDGAIVVREGDKTREMQAEERPLTVSLLEGAASSAAVPPPAPPSSRATRTAVAPRPSVRSSLSNGRRGPAVPSWRSRLSKEENERLTALGARLKAMRDASRGRSTQAANQSDGMVKMMQKMLSDAQREEAEAASRLRQSVASEDANTPPVPSNKIQSSSSRTRSRR